MLFIRISFTSSILHDVVCEGFDLQLIEEDKRTHLKMLAPLEGKYTCSESIYSCGSPILYRDVDHDVYTHIAIFLRAAWPPCNTPHVEYVKKVNASNMRKQEVQSLSWNVALVKGKGTANLPQTPEMLMTATITDRTRGYHPRYLTSLKSWQLPKKLVTFSNASAEQFQGSNSYVACRFSEATTKFTVTKKTVTALRRRLRACHSTRIGL